MKAVSCVYMLIGAAIVLTQVASPTSALDVLIADDDFDDDLSFLVTALPDHNVTHVDNVDASNNPVRTNDVNYMLQFDVVIFYASGDLHSGRQIGSAEQTALEAYIQAGGNLIVTGHDVIGDPNDPRLADVVRSSTFGDESNNTPTWTAANVDHFILNGPFGDFRGMTFAPARDDHDDLTADAARGAVSLGFLDDEPYDKIAFTDVPAPGGSVGMWNGNGGGDDWDPTEQDGDGGLAMLRNWLAGLADADGDGVFDSDDLCPGTAAGDPVDAEGCSTDDDDGDGVLDDQDDCPDTRAGAAVDASGCPTGCCGASGPVAPLGMAVGMLLLSRFAGYRNTRRR